MYQPVSPCCCGASPVKNVVIAVAVVVEHGGFGATAAAPIARKVMDAFLLKTKAAPAPAAMNVVPGNTTVALPSVSASADKVTDQARTPSRLSP